MDDASRPGIGSVPMHLRDAHYKGARRLGHGAGYVYPHDDPVGALTQEYRPAEVAGNVYYRPAKEPDPDERD